MNRMIARLERQLETETESSIRAELGARLVVALARIGRFRDAHERISSMRSEESVARGSAGTLWVMLAEGVTMLYESISPSALDRINRADALAKAMNYRAIRGLTSAWKAHIEFEGSNFQAMGKSLAAARQHDDLNDLDARTRNAIVLANAFAYAGNFRQSYKWFLKGHEFAVSNGDRASIEALQYNRAAMRLAWLRVEQCRGALSADDLKAIRVELGSAQGLQQLMRVDAYVNHLELCGARLNVLEGNYQKAVAALRQVKTLAPFAANNFSQDLIDAEIAYCQAAAGQIDQALKTYKVLTEDMIHELDVDDQLVARWMAANLAGMDSRFVTGNSAEAVQTLLIQVDSSRAQLRAMLIDFEL